MREYKFRGKDYVNKWRYGDLVQEKWRQGKVIMIKKDKTAWSILEETVGQYTGLKDKNGKEIYEGDIVKVFSMGDYTEGYVKYSSDKGRFDIGWKSEIKNYMKNEFVGSFAIMKNDYDLLEVIGNIYDNTELLGGSDGRD